MKAEKIKAVLWDKDGTLLDNFSLWIRRERILLESVCTDLEIRENLRADAVEAGLRAIGIKDGRIDPHGELAGGTEASICAAMAQALGEFCTVPEAEDFRRLVNGHLHEVIAEDSEAAPLRDGVLKALTTVKTLGIPQGLATSDSRKSALKELSPYGIEKYFSYFSFGDEALRPKPDPWCLLEFSRRTGVPASSILFIGDSPVDEKTARAAGARFCALLGGAGAREDFLQETVILENISGIAELIL